MVAPSVAPSNIAARASAAAPDASRRFWITLGLILALAGANAFCVASAHQPLTTYGLFVASAILWVCAFPPWLFLVTPRRSLGFLPAVCGLYAIYFAWPAFSATPLFRLSMREPVWSSVEVALTVALLGAVALVAGAVGSGRALARMPRIHREIDLRRALPLLVFASTIGFLLRFARTGSNSQFNMIFLTVESIGLIALGGILLAWLRGLAQWWHKAYLVGLTLGIAVLGLATGSLANVAFPMAGLVFIYCWERMRFPLGALLTGALVLAPFQASKHEFRAINWAPNSTVGTAGASSLADLDRLLTSFLTITIAGAEEGRMATGDIVDASEGRTNMLSEMALVVEETPDEIPYWNGYTYSELGWHLIPRVLVPDKPAPIIAQEFPRRYGLIAYQDTGTSYNLAQTVELYVNFGWIGVGLGMLLIGVMYTMLDHAFSASSGGALIGSVVFSGLMDIESHFSDVWGGLPLLLAAFYAFIRMLPSVKSEVSHSVAGAAGG